MKRIIALLTLACGLAVLVPASPANAVGLFPTQYGCLHNFNTWQLGLAGGTYVNDASIYGIAWAVSESNYYYNNPNSCTATQQTQHVAQWLETDVGVWRYFQGQWLNCTPANHYTLHSTSSYIDYSFGQPIGPWSPCTWANYPAGLTHIFWESDWTDLGSHRNLPWNFYS